jgi:hypothetical protein
MIRDPANLLQTRYIFFYISWGLVVPRSMGYASKWLQSDVSHLLSGRKDLTRHPSPLDRTPETIMPTRKGLTFDTAGVYQIGVQGCLDESWSDRMNGVDIRVQDLPDEAPVTVLIGHFVDQAALAGVLSTLYDLGFPLLTVELLEAQPLRKA